MQIQNYKPIAVTDENTVVSEHTHSDNRDNSYQSEADMEREIDSVVKELEVGVV